MNIVYRHMIIVEVFGENILLFEVCGEAIRKRHRFVCLSCGLQPPLS